MIICVECGKEMNEQFEGQDWCEECHIAFHKEYEEGKVNKI